MISNGSSQIMPVIDKKIIPYLPEKERKNADKKLRFFCDIHSPIFKTFLQS